MEIKDYLDLYEGRLKLREVSYLGLSPGDVIIFNYEDGSRRIGLVVSSSRTSSGYFISTRNNTLLNVFLLDQLTDSMFELMVNNLYQRPSRCSYYSRKILGVFLKKENFRTFNIAKTSNIISIGITR